MKIQHVIEAQQFNRELLEKIFEESEEMENIAFSGGSEILKHSIMATVFYEPSTRTRLSFESAMLRLGGEVISTENAKEFSSAAKGESLQDTIRTLQCYSDIIVLRHYESGAAKSAVEVAKVPVINAGDGSGQHPTQSLLDMYTIKQTFSKFENLNIAMVGDLENGRTVRSLSYLLAKYQGVKIIFVSPDCLKMRDDIKEYLDRHSIKWEETGDLREVASQVDVIYMTRIQRERLLDRPNDYEEARGKFVVDKTIIDLMKKEAILLHPLPRVDEISTDVDSNYRSVYFKQAQNGLFVRMALLKMCLIG
ncbi:aspartate carbamoyltransferase [candidate division WOR-3 bacterium]|nr:aspartate carbamoyltransferase [candidate division WOR-3 bacterium]